MDFKGEDIKTLVKRAEDYKPVGRRFVLAREATGSDHKVRTTILWLPWQPVAYIKRCDGLI